MNINLSKEEVQKEIERIEKFIDNSLKSLEKAVIPISGGLDCDVVARLAARVVKRENLKLFTAIQEDMEDKHLNNARLLAKDLGIELVEINLKEFPFDIMKRMAVADLSEDFKYDGLDAMRMKCNLRTAILSSYQDHGYLVIGTRNKTEYETGFYLPLGDGVCHINPIIHLYKTQVKQLAKELGTRDEVINQPGSAGFWKGEEDIEDLAWWLYNEGPIRQEIESTAEDDKNVEKIKSELTVLKIDQIIDGIKKGRTNKEIVGQVDVSEKTVYLFQLLLDEANRFKHLPLNVAISD